MAKKITIWICGFAECIYFGKECPMQYGRCAYCNQPMIPKGVKCSTETAR